MKKSKILFLFLIIFIGFLEVNAGATLNDDTAILMNKNINKELKGIISMKMW
jgi:hypothetical protein